MGLPKKDNPLRGAGVSITRDVKAKLIEAARKKGISLSRFMGEILTEYAKELPETWIDPNQTKLPL